MKDKVLKARLLKKYSQLMQELSSIGPTPLRQLLDAHIVVSRNALITFDQDLYETDLSYARRADKAKDKANDMPNVLWDS